MRHCKPYETNSCSVTDCALLCLLCVCSEYVPVSGAMIHVNATAAPLEHVQLTHDIHTTAATLAIPTAHLMQHMDTTAYQWMAPIITARPTTPPTNTTTASPLTSDTPAHVRVSHVVFVTLSVLYRSSSYLPALCHLHSGSNGAHLSSSLSMDRFSVACLFLSKLLLWEWLPRPLEHIIVLDTDLRIQHDIQHMHTTHNTQHTRHATQHGDGPVYLLAPERQS